MTKRLLIFAILAGASYGAYYLYTKPPTALVLTGIVTTHDVVVAPQIGGRLVALSVREGDTVTKGQAIAEIEPSELEAERAYYDHSAEGVQSQIREGEAALRFQERQLTDQITQAEATVANTVAQVAAATADAERAKSALERTRELFKAQLATGQSMDDARTGYEAAQARVDAGSRQVDAARAALALARTNAEQVEMRRSQIQTA